MSDYDSFIWGTEGWRKAVDMLCAAGVSSVSDVETLLATPAAMQFRVKQAEIQYHRAKTKYETAKKEAAHLV